MRILSLSGDINCMQFILVDTLVLTGYYLTKISDFLKVFMISYINGIIKNIQGQLVIIDIGSIGLAVHVPENSIFKVGEKTLLHMHMHWNQEQGPSLYGFVSELERTVFLLVTSCSGLGPKIALAVLAQLGAQAFLAAIQSGDERALSKVSGIGIKKAEQMIVQLKHKVAKLLDSGIKIEGSGELEQWRNVSEVLSSLHYSQTEIARAMKYLNEHHANNNASFDQLIRHALSFLVKKS